MFSERELKGLDRGYFNIIMANDYDLTLMSKNTGHYWYLDVYKRQLQDRVIFGYI